MDPSLQQDSLRIVVGFDLSIEERQIVQRAAIDMFNDVAPLSLETEAGALGRGPGVPEYLIAISTFGTFVVTTAKAIADSIIEWRRNVPQQNILKTTITLMRQGMQPLDPRSRPSSVVSRSILALPELLLPALTSRACVSIRHYSYQLASQLASR